MKVQVQGVLKARSAAAAEAALAAFDEQAYVEFFSAELWEQAGPFLLCQATFEVAADCDPTNAFRAIVEQTSSGLVEMVHDGQKRGTKYSRSKDKYKFLVETPLLREHFGNEVARALDTWRVPIEKARSSAKKRSARASRAKRAPSSPVDVGGFVYAVAPVPPGRFALALKDEVVVVSTEGRIEARIPHRSSDGPAFEPVGITALDDGTLVLTGEHSRMVRVVDRELGSVREIELERARTFHEVRPLEGGFVTPTNPITIVRGDTVTTLDVPDEWAKAVTWGDRIVVASDEKNLVFGLDGQLLFETQGGRVTPIGDRIYTSWKSRYGRTEADGAFHETAISTGYTLVPVGEDLFGSNHPTGTATRYTRDEEVVWSAPRLYGTGPGRPIVLDESTVVMTPATYPTGARMLVVDFASGEARGDVVGKGHLDRTYRVNAGTVVALANGRGAKDLHVFHGLRDKPAYEAVKGHKASITDVVIANDVLLTRSEDGMTRLVDLAHTRYAGPGKERV